MEYSFNPELGETLSYERIKQREQEILLDYTLHIRSSELILAESSARFEKKVLETILENDKIISERIQIYNKKIGIICVEIMDRIILETDVDKIIKEINTTRDKLILGFIEENKIKVEEKIMFCKTKYRGELNLIEKNIKDLIDNKISKLKSIENNYISNLKKMYSDAKEKFIEQKTEGMDVIIVERKCSHDLDLNRLKSESLMNTVDITDIKLEVKKIKNLVVEIEKKQKEGIRSVSGKEQTPTECIVSKKECIVSEKTPKVVRSVLETQNFIEGNIEFNIPYEPKYYDPLTKDVGLMTKSFFKGMRFINKKIKKKIPSIKDLKRTMFKVYTITLNSDKGNNLPNYDFISKITREQYNFMGFNTLWTRKKIKKHRNLAGYISNKISKKISLGYDLHRGIYEYTYDQTSYLVELKETLEKTLNIKLPNLTLNQYDHWRVSKVFGYNYKNPTYQIGEPIDLFDLEFDLGYE